MREPTTQPERRPGLFRRLIAFVVTLALVLGAVALVANWDNINIDSIRRYFAYRTLERNDSGQAESFSFGGDAAAFAPLNGGLLVCSTVSARLYSGSGELMINQPISMEEPVALSAGDLALVYDAGGTGLYLFSDAPEPVDLSMEEGSSILSARLSEAGWLTVVSQESGHRGTVTVYDAGQIPVLQINLSSSFVADAVLSPDNSQVAVVTIGLSESGTFDTQINLYRLDRSEEETAPDASCSVGNNVALDLRWRNGRIWLLGENSLALAGSDGSLAADYAYGGRYLKAYSMGGDGFAALLLGKYRGGSAASLEVVDAEGQVSASVDLSDQVLSLSAAGRYICVLTAGKLTIYTQDLTVYNTLDSVQGARQAIQRADGSVMLIDAESARLYIPG